MDIISLILAIVGLKCRVWGCSLAALLVTVIGFLFFINMQTPSGLSDKEVVIIFLLEVAMYIVSFILSIKGLSRKR